MIFEKKNKKYKTNCEKYKKRRKKNKTKVIINMHDTKSNSSSNIKRGAKRRARNDI